MDNQTAGVDLDKLRADIKHLTKLADDVGRSRQSNNYAMNSGAVEKLVDLEASVLDRVAALARRAEPSVAAVGEREFVVEDNDLQAFLDAAVGWVKGAPQNMDTGLYMLDLLQRVEVRLAREKAAALASPAVSQHPDDAAVDRFAAAMKAKMAASRAKGRGGWDDPAACTAVRLQTMLVDHLAKGDPVDVGNFAMMLWDRGERTTNVGPAFGNDGSEPDWSAYAAAEAATESASKIKTWQERCDWWSERSSTKLMVEAMKAEIADLRAALAQQGAPHAPLDDNEVARLRRVVRALGMEKEVPQDAETLRGCLFSVLGQIAYKLESRASHAANAGEVDLTVIDAAFEQEIKRVSTLPYNSNEICREFYKNLRAAIASSAAQEAKV